MRRSPGQRSSQHSRGSRRHRESRKERRELCKGPEAGALPSAASTGRSADDPVREPGEHVCSLPSPPAPSHQGSQLQGRRSPGSPLGSPRGWPPRPEERGWERPWEQTQPQAGLLLWGSETSPQGVDTLMCPQIILQGPAGCSFAQYQCCIRFLCVPSRDQRLQTGGHAPHLLGDIRAEDQAYTQSP